MRASVALSAFAAILYTKWSSRYLSVKKTGKRCDVDRKYSERESSEKKDRGRAEQSRDIDLKGL